MNTLLLPRKWRGYPKIDVEEWHNSLSRLLHLRIKAPLYVREINQRELSASAVAMPDKTNTREDLDADLNFTKKKPTTSKQFFFFLLQRQFNFIVVQFFQMSRLVSQARPLNHLEFKPRP